MKPTDAIARAPGMASASPLVALPGHAPKDPLDVLLEHLKGHPRVDAAAFLRVSGRRSRVEKVTAWFAFELLGEAVEAAVGQAPGGELAGLVAAPLERDRPLFLPRIEDWEAAAGLRGQVEARASTGAWDALRRASVIGCPVRSPVGKVLGVLVVASVDERHPLERADVETVEVLADLAAHALERAELLASETLRAREELLLKRAAEDAAGSLEVAEVERQAAEHVLELVGAEAAALSRVQPGTRRLTPTATAGPSLDRDGAGLDPGTLAEVARTRTAVRRDDPVAVLHVPIALGHRLFGVLSAVRRDGPPFAERDVELLGSLARISAAALANAVDFGRERRIARALTRGFVPAGPLQVPGYDVGLLYEPADDQPAGGDLFGTWRLPSGEVGVVVGDVAGKGVETAALSAMARFFIEARSWDSDSPAEILAEAGQMLSSRLPSDTFVTALLGILGCDRIRYASAGHLPALVLRADGELTETAVRGLPLGVVERPRYEELELALGPGDLVLGFTDGLVEARREGVLLGSDRLAEMVAEVAARTGRVQELVRALHEEVHEWASGLSDDVVILGLRRSAG